MRFFRILVTTSLLLAVAGPLFAADILTTWVTQFVFPDEGILWRCFKYYNLLPNPGA